MFQRSIPSKSRAPGQPVRIVIESADLAYLPIPSHPFGGIDVRVCSGPSGPEEVCPLVTDGACPLGACDVVVSDLDGPWADSIHNAWLLEGVVVTATRDESSAVADQFDERLGAALTALYRTTYAAASRSGDAR